MKVCVLGLGRFGYNVAITLAHKGIEILAIDDNEDILFSLKLLLKQHVEFIHTESDPELIPRLMKQENYDVILLDMNFTKDAISGQEGYHWLDRIIEIDPRAVVLFITAYGDIEKSVKAIKAGATDFILKPWQNEKLVATVSAGVKLRKSRIEAAQLKKTNQLLASASAKADQKMLGQSPIMSNIMSLIKRVASSDANILVLGENGTGKELVARQLHQQSLRADQVFISVDMGALSETLFESELFGHKKGAFTGAHNDRIGRFHAAEGGTLFLDEVGNIPLHLQKKSI